MPVTESTPTLGRHLQDIRELGDPDEGELRSERLDLLVTYLLPVHSVRRGLVMDRVVAYWNTHSEYSFTVVFSSAEHRFNKELIETIMAFIGTDTDNLDAVFTGALRSGWSLFHAGRTESVGRGHFTPVQRAELEALEASIEIFNAPFWEDRYEHDPVIVRTGVNGYWDFEGTTFIITSFTVYLYDLESWDLSVLREELSEITGIDPDLIELTRAF
ncbi:MAG: hypothetical protein FWC90_04210 [Oscillospiraceae bacterium]|nr:hypothetical protein [Oscillospiraceae bacterium]